MISMVINGLRAYLRRGTSVTVDYVPPAMADGIEDSYSLPFELPSNGNEEALEHLHVLDAQERPSEFDARMEHNGVPLHQGKLEVLASTPKTVRTAFYVDALIQRVRNVRLREALAGQVIDILDWGAIEAAPTYTAGGACQFPMYLNRELYGDSNPDYKPDTQKWSDTATYAVDDLVTFVTRDTIEREGVYQCIAATTAGQSPTTTPAKWRLAAFGLVNAWNKTSNGHYYNTTRNFYAFVPWFYWKWVLRQALASIDLQLKGDWYDDPGTHDVLVPNNTTIDRDTRSGDVFPYFFSVGQPGLSFAQGDYVPVRATNEAAPFQDPDDVWDSDDFVFTVPAAGPFFIRVTVRPNELQSVAGFNLPIVFYMHDEAVAPSTTPYAVTSGYQNLDTLVAQGEFVLNFTSGDIGRRFKFNVNARYQHPVTGLPSGWPSSPSAHFSQGVITGWQLEPETVSVPDQFIRAERHMPDITVEDFLLATVDIFNLQMKPDLSAGTLRLDYKEDILRRVPTNITEATDRVRGDAEIDHRSKLPGWRFRWNVDGLTEGVPDTAPVYPNEQAFAAPLAVGVFAIAAGTRKVFRSVFEDGDFWWKADGYSVPPALRGNRDNAREVVPGAKPLHMEQVSLDGELYQVPVWDAPGTSGRFNVTNTQSELRIAVWKRMRSHSGTVTNVPGARSWGLGWSADDRATPNLLPDMEDNNNPGITQRFWRGWVAMLLQAERVVVDLAVDLPWLIGRAWHNLLHIGNQRYLVERMPVEFQADRTELMARGTYLRSVRAFNPPPISTTFICAGPGYGSVTTNAGGSLVVATEDGYATVRLASNGTLNTQADGVPMPLTGLSSYCLWASDVNGQVRNGLLELYDYDGGITGLYLEGLLELSFLDTLSAELSVLQLPPSGNLVILSAPSAQLVGLDLTGQTALWQIYATFGPQATALDFSGCLDLETIQISGENLANIVPPPNQTLRSVALVGALTSASVDAIINALDPTFIGIVCELSGGTNAPRTAASNANYNAVIANGGTILTN